MNPKKSKRGGPRPGAGRPQGRKNKRPAGKTVSMSVRVPRELKALFFARFPPSERAAKVAGWIAAECGPVAERQT